MVFKGTLYRMLTGKAFFLHLRDSYSEITWRLLVTLNIESRTCESELRVIKRDKGKKKLKKKLLSSCSWPARKAQNAALRNAKTRTASIHQLTSTSWQLHHFITPQTMSFHTQNNQCFQPAGPAPTSAAWLVPGVPPPPFARQLPRCRTFKRVFLQLVPIRFQGFGEDQPQPCPREEPSTPTWSPWPASSWRRGGGPKAPGSWPICSILCARPSKPSPVPCAKPGSHTCE